MRATVGIFDSGVGGLSVAEALHRLAPSLPIHYLADTAFFPYGERSAAEIQERSVAMVRRLIDEGANVVVVACNTASSAALERLRAEFSVPIVGMEPPVKPAVERSRSGRVLVLATTGTVSGQRLARLTERHSGDADVVTIPMPGLADVVEAGEIDGKRVEQMLRLALAEPVAQGVDQVALGCTHYAFLRPLLRRILPAHVELVDAGEPVARRTLHLIAEAGLDVGGDVGAGSPEVPDVPEEEVLCYATGDFAAFESTVERLRAAGAALPPIRIFRPVARRSGVSKDSPYSAGGRDSMTAAVRASFNARLQAAAQQNHSLLCVGLDPDPQRIPAGVSTREFLMRIVEATADIAACYKPNLGFFEPDLGAGIELVRDLIEAIHARGIPVLLDAKRGDLGNTAIGYARAIYEALDADATTVNPYMGLDSLEPFLAYEDRTAFILCRTSNPGARDLQDLRVGERQEPLYMHVARLANAWNTKRNVGLVVGATYPQEAQEIRAICPELPILMPGVGAQAGDLEAAVRAGIDATRAGLIVNASRGVLYAPPVASADRPHWAEGARVAAIELRDAINAVRGA